ncbi:cytochrome P450 [Actinophytocola algeriensis]|uniref:Cytochrome P450 n=1 Tax=Actinophytocola algeriensis TaxID=1768010 RepID=A0A7W7Q7F4_9PSEU|nr:cytochrome P450 [Actinophytocola algeriensis]MBB4908440.1 cytochrome P450 [Actinophytocola algeriensis]MBE1475173.1 cytochrome P450 [Actinophytocola algeriensis]
MPLPTPPGPANFVRTMLTYQKAPLAFLTNVLDTHGDVASFRLAANRIILLRHPHHIRRVLQQKAGAYDRSSMPYKMSRTLFGRGLATVEGGEEWRSMRRLMQPSFHYQRVATMAEHMLAVIQARLERWDEKAAAGEVIDTAPEMRSLTLRVVARALFALEEGEVCDRFATAIDTVDHELGAWMQFPLLPLSVPTAGHRRYWANRAVVEEIIDYVITQHLTDQVDRGDLLSMLIMTEDEETGARLTDEQLRDQVMIMLWAGHETGANVLTWTWYRLGMHPEVQQRVLREIDDELDGRPPTLADCSKLTYTRSVLDEVQRLYPQQWLASRRSLEEDEIGGFRVPAGTDIFFSPYHAHRHPEFWDEPEEFRPERFTADEVAKRDRSAYLPFGSGPHLCIGNQFAMTEMLLVIASTLQRYRLELESQDPVVPRPLLTLGPEKPIRVRLVPRGRSSS